MSVLPNNGVGSEGDHVLVDEATQSDVEENEILRNELESLKAEQAYAEFKTALHEVGDITELRAMSAVAAIKLTSPTPQEEDKDDADWDPEASSQDEAEVGDELEVEAKEEELAGDSSEEDDDETELSDVDETEDEAVRQELLAKGKLSDVKVPGVMKKEQKIRYPAMWRTGRNLQLVSAEEEVLERAIKSGVEVPAEEELDPDYQPEAEDKAKESEEYREANEGEDEEEMEPEGEESQEDDEDADDEVLAAQLDTKEIQAEAAILTQLEKGEKMDEDISALVEALNIADKDMEDGEVRSQEEEVVVLAEAITSFDDSTYVDGEDPDYEPGQAKIGDDVESDSGSSGEEDIGDDDDMQASDDAEGAMEH